MVLLSDQNHISFRNKLISHSRTWIRIKVAAKIEVSLISSSLVSPKRRKMLELVIIYLNFVLSVNICKPINLLTTDG
jgi:hypothetical protein